MGTSSPVPERCPVSAALYTVTELAEKVRDKLTSVLDPTSRDEPQNAVASEQAPLLHVIDNIKNILIDIDDRLTIW